MKERWKQSHMRAAHIYAQNSEAIRRKVGCLIVKGDEILSVGINGTPAGYPNHCEVDDGNGNLVTHQAVLHAEANAFAKMGKSTRSCEGATMFVTLSPCPACAILIKAFGIEEVYFEEQYRDPAGISLLRELGIKVTQLDTGAVAAADIAANQPLVGAIQQPGGRITQ